MKSEREERLSRHEAQPYSTKKAYKSPVILGYGTIAKLTQGRHGSGTDFRNMRMGGMMM